MSGCSELSTSTDLPGFRDPFFDVFKKFLRLLQGLSAKSVTWFSIKRNVDLCSTYRKVSASVMTLVVDEVGNGASPASRDRKQLVREEGIAQRLVEEGRRGRRTRPLGRWSV